jgi:hypothetical protein
MTPTMRAFVANLGTLFQALLDAFADFARLVNDLTPGQRQAIIDAAEEDFDGEDFDGEDVEDAEEEACDLAAEASAREYELIYPDGSQRTSRSGGDLELVGHEELSISLSFIDAAGNPVDLAGGDLPLRPEDVIAPAGAKILHGLAAEPMQAGASVSLDHPGSSFYHLTRDGEPIDAMALNRATHGQPVALMAWPVTPPAPPSAEYFTLGDGSDPIAGEVLRAGQIVRFDWPTLTLRIATQGCIDPVGVACHDAQPGQRVQVVKKATFSVGPPLTPSPFAGLPESVAVGRDNPPRVADDGADVPTIREG